MSRFFRSLVCVFVICCLLVNLSPIKADATAAGIVAPIVGGATVTVSAPLVIAASLIALGIMVGTNDDFQRVVSNAVTDLGDWVKDGTVELFQTVDELGKKSYYVSADMMEDLRSYILGAEVIKSKELVFDSMKYPSADVLATAASAFYSNLVYWTYTWDESYVSWIIVYSNESPVIAKSVGNSIVIETKDGNATWFMTSSVSNGWSTGTGVAYSGANMKIISAQEFGEKIAKFNTDYDLTLGQVSSVPVDGASASEWSEAYTNRGLYVDPSGDGDGNDDDGKWWYPLALFPTLPQISELTQPDEWNGETPDDFDEYVPGQEYDVEYLPDIEIEWGTPIEIKPVIEPGLGDDTEVDPGPTDDTADYTSWFDNIVGFLHDIWASIIELPSKFAAWFESIIEGIAALPSEFATWFEAILEGISALPGNFATWFETIIDGIQAIPDVISGWITDVIEWLTSIWEAICSIPTLILDGITAIFVPSEDFLTEKVQDLRNRFDWIEPILGYGDYIKAQLIDPEPPVLYVHLGNAEGSYNYGGTVKFLDLTWYERYKSQGDAIISGFLWALFAWRMYVKLPGIINGVAGDVGHISYGESAWQKAEGRKERKEKGGKDK